MRNDELQLGEALEQIRRHALVERGGVAVQVVRAGGVKRRIARRADMDHRRHVQLDHLLIDRIPVRIAQRRIGPIPARRIGIQIAADEAVLQHAAFQLGDAVARRHAGALRQHADTGEVAREQRADPMDQIVARGRPGLAGGRIAEMVTHARGARRKDRQVGAAFLLQLQLAADDALADVVVADRRPRRRGPPLLVCRNLLLPPRLVLARRRGVMPVAIDDHGPSVKFSRVRQSLHTDRCVRSR
jgi:hypothetical protein